MRLDQFPDPRQITILEFLEENCTGSRPADGCDSSSLLNECGFDAAEMELLVSDLQKRDLVSIGYRTPLNEIDGVAITVRGRDLLHHMRNRERLEDEGTGETIGFRKPRRKR